MKTIMLENSIALRVCLKQLKGMAKKINGRNGSSLSYNDCQCLLKQAAQNHYQKIQTNPPRVTRKVHARDAMSEITK